MGEIAWLEDFLDDCELDNQVYNMAHERSYEFNLMLVGESGVGKSSLVTSLFIGKIKPEDATTSHNLDIYSETIEDGFKVTCIESSNSSDAHVKYIDRQFEDYFKAKIRVSPEMKDNLVHCCLYLIQPYTKLKLRTVDLDCMRALHKKVNLIPIIAQSDKLNPQEMVKFKENIVEDLELNKIDYFKFVIDRKEDEELSELVKAASKRFPFAVMAADELLEKDMSFHWNRTTMAGPIDINDTNKSDFKALSQLLSRYCMLDLMEITHEKHYAKWRSELYWKPENLDSLGLETFEVNKICADMGIVRAK